MLFSLLKHYLDLYISDTALKVFRSLYCFTTSICHGVENFFPRLWGTGISDAIFYQLEDILVQINTVCSVTSHCVQDVVLSSPTSTYYCRKTTVSDALLFKLVTVTSLSVVISRFYFINGDFVDTQNILYSRQTLHS